MMLMSFYYLGVIDDARKLSALGSPCVGTTLMNERHLG